MTNHGYSAEFREWAVRQILEGDFSVKGVSERLGVSTQNLYRWVNAVKPSPDQRWDEELLEANRENLK